MQTFTAAQLRAVGSTSDPLQIIACAGSGKTQVISSRVARLLEDDGVKPAAIVAFTFTERAATELKDRISASLAAPIVGLADMFVGTMHAYALDLLHSWVPDTFKFSVLNDVQTRLIIDRNSSKSGLTTTPTVSAGTPTLRRFIHSKLYQQILSILREDNVDVAQVPVEVLESEAKYRELLVKHRYLDYSEILLAAVEYLEADPEDPERGMLARHVRDTIDHVVVDEYQDVNPLQERLVRALCRFGAVPCVVGDDDQTIYQWRGSQLSNLQDFPKRFAGTVTEVLDDNFRSSAAIVELGRDIAEANAGDRIEKRMQAAGHQQFEWGDVLALEFADEDAEVSAICDRILKLRGTPFQDSVESSDRGLSWSDMAVLFRSVYKDAGSLVAEFDRREIPYIIKGLSRLFDAAEVAACVASFSYMVGRSSADDVVTAWMSANLGLTEERCRQAIHVLDEGRDWSSDERWGKYNIQRTYLTFLEELHLREESIPSAEGTTRGELVFYNLGKFSQAISDFEQINFSSDPRRKYESFVDWLVHQAPDYYDQSDADTGYGTPDAVVISTVHQAKGLQWPAVFLPAMRTNRFPSRRQGGLNVFHVIPSEAVAESDRYRGLLEDERRLFYVAVTRAQKYLTVSFSPGTKRGYQRPSEFFVQVSRFSKALTRPAISQAVGGLVPTPRTEVPDITVSFSELKYFFECPYSFKLRFLYGFNPPIHEALGYGKSLHDALSEMHKRALEGDLVDASDIDELVDRHLNTPFAYPELRRQLHSAAERALTRYLVEHATDLPLTVHSEKQIQIRLADGIIVDGRIDLVKRIDSGETSIVDFKSNERVQEPAITRDQLHTYAVGYLELTGESADFLEVVNLDENAPGKREQVDSLLLDSMSDKIALVGNQLRENDLPRLTSWCRSCANCDLVGLCRERENTA